MAKFSQSPEERKKLAAIFGVVFLAAFGALFGYQFANSVGPICVLNSVQVPRAERIALIEPIFTSTPYRAGGSFYSFYAKYANANGTILTDLGWLNTSVSRGFSYYYGWGQDLPLYNFVISYAGGVCGFSIGGNTKVVTDLQVSAGALVANGVRNFDTVIFGHEEYMTRSGYDQFKQFVADGGRLIDMSGDTFHALVNYSTTTGMETYVMGHGFAFNGTAAWRTGERPFDNSSRSWFGSVYCCGKEYALGGSKGTAGAVINASVPMGEELTKSFGATVFSSYGTHEENGVTNFTDTQIIATFPTEGSWTIAAYIHEYHKGAVFNVSVFSEDILATSASAQYFLVLAVITPWQK